MRRREKVEKVAPAGFHAYQLSFHPAMGDNALEIREVARQADCKTEWAIERGFETWMVEKGNARAMEGRTIGKNNGQKKRMEVPICEDEKSQIYTVCE